MKKTSIRDNIWVLKIIGAVLSLVMTIRFIIPAASVPSTVMQTQLSAEKTVFPEQVLTQENRSSELFSCNITEKGEAPSEEGTSETSEGTPLYEYETPEDVLEFEKEYLAVFSQEEAYGTVEEVFFKTSGATDSVNGIHIKNATATKKPDFSLLMSEGPELKKADISQPLVLIFHTHTTESYLLSDNGVFYEDYQTRSTDSTKNMVRIGDEICKVLEANGIGYIHDTAIYDESYDGAYGRSRVSVEEYLEKYPTIQIVLDVHRDAIYYSDTSHCKPTAEINGRKAAQIMIITGAQEGYITDFPDWEKNLRFALSVQKTAEASFPGLMKPLYFCQRKYNMDTSPCSLLLEVGTDANTLDEAIYSGYLTGQVLSLIIKEYCGD